jgi:hypothetical protein
LKKAETNLQKAQGKLCRASAAPNLSASRLICHRQLEINQVALAVIFTPKHRENLIERMKNLH